jgi:predicted Rossmann fold flavoprotein
MSISPALSAEVLILGAGAAGLMCAIEAGKRGRKVVVIDHARKPAEKIRISGGGRCNFTNLHASPKNYLSQNPHFCVSALKRYTPQDFIALVRKHRIAYHEKTLGQLFCDDSSQRIIDLLLEECRAAGVTLHLATSLTHLSKPDGRFRVESTAGRFTPESVVVACGGLSIPKMGATGLGYDIARQFGLEMVPPLPALVPFTLGEAELASLNGLTGISTEAEASMPASGNGKTTFREGILFTHRGLSGPSILQISSYWKPGETVTVNLAPNHDTFSLLRAAKESHPRQEAATVLATFLPKRLAQSVVSRFLPPEKQTARLAEIGNPLLNLLAGGVNRWQVKPVGTEGYRTAEVTLGGVDTQELSSKTMEAVKIPGLYFIGEVVDVTGHLGGYNFQWAWASGHAAGQVV